MVTQAQQPMNIPEEFSSAHHDICIAEEYIRIAQVATKNQDRRKMAMCWAKRYLERAMMTLHDIRSHT